CPSAQQRPDRFHLPLRRLRRARRVLDEHQAHGDLRRGRIHPGNDPGPVPDLAGRLVPYHRHRVRQHRAQHPADDHHGARRPRRLGAAEDRVLLRLLPELLHLRDHRPVALPRLLRVRGDPLGREHGAARPGRGRPRHRPLVPAGRPHHRPAAGAAGSGHPAGQHPDRADQEHHCRRRGLGGGGLRTDEHDDRVQPESDDLHLPHHRDRLLPAGHPDGLPDHLALGQAGGGAMSSTVNVLFDAPGPKAKRNVLLANLIALAGVLVLAALVLLQLDRQGQLRAHLWLNAVNGNAWTNYYLPGLQFTLQSSGIAVVTAMIFGLIFGFLRLAPFAIIRGASGLVVEFFRAVPVLVMMFFLYFFLSRRVAPTGLFASEDSAYFAVIIGLTVYNGAVIAELIRSGVRSLPKGQREAAAAIGMTNNQSLRIVEVPQALTAMLPSLLSQFVVILKDSALGFLIGFYELLQYSRQLGSGYSNILQSLVMAAL